MTRAQVENIQAKGPDGGCPNLEFLYGALTAEGYAVGHRTLNSYDFGIPQRRMRVFFVALSLQGFELETGAAEDLIAQIFDTACSLQHDAPEFAAFLLPDSHRRVQEELARASAATASTKDAGQHGAVKWVDQHRELYHTKGLGFKDLNMEQWASNAWFKLQSRRAKECLAYWTHSIHAEPGKVLTSLDVTPRIDRCSKGFGGVLQTLTPGMNMWAIRQPSWCSRPVLGHEAMRLQGFPVAWIDEAEAKGLTTATDPQLADLAGNAFTSNVIASIYMAILATIPVPKAVSKSRSDVSAEVDFDKLAALMT